MADSTNFPHGIYAPSAGNKVFVTVSEGITGKEADGTGVLGFCGKTRNKRKAIRYVDGI